MTRFLRFWGLHFPIDTLSIYTVVVQGAAHAKTRRWSRAGTAETPIDSNKGDISMDANKQKALDAALGQIERQFGKGTVMRMGDQERQAIPAVSTGSLGLDIALGIGGIPRASLTCQPQRMANFM